MNKILREPAVLVIIYVLVGLITFGHAYHAVPETEQSRFGGIEYTVQNGTGTRVYGGFLCAMAWPLYWSVQVWR